MADDDDDKGRVRTVNAKDLEAPKQTQLYYEDGSPIPMGEVTAAIESGKAYSNSDNVNVREGNRTVSVGTGDLANVLAERGANVETTRQAEQRLLKEDAESAGGMAKTVGEGLVRGATLGFADPALFYDAEGREAALARQRFNPYLSGGSELAGAIGGGIATGLLTGGAGLGAGAGRLAARRALSPWMAADALGGVAERGAVRLLGEGLAGRAGGLAARGAAEGTVMGAGHEVSQSVLTNTPLTAERLLAGMGEGATGGAILGGGLGVLAHGLSAGGKAVLGKVLGGEGFESSIKSFAEKRAFKQVTGNARKFFDEATDHGSNLKRPERIGRKLLDAQIPDDTGAAIKVLGDRTEEAASRLKAVAAEMDTAGVKVNSTKILGAVDDQIAKIKEVPSAAYQRVAKRIEAEIKPFRKAVASGDEYSFSRLWEFRQKLDKTVKWESKQRGPAEEALKDMVGAFRSELDDAIERAIAADTTGAVARASVGQADDAAGILGMLDDFGGMGGKAANDVSSVGRVSDDLLTRWKAAKEDYADFNLAKRAAKDLALRNEKNRFFSPTDYGTGGLAGVLMGVMTGGGWGMVAGAATNLAVSAAHKLVRERGAGMLARIADRSTSVAGRVDMAAKVAAMIESPKKLAPAVAVNVHRMFDRYQEALSKDDAEVAQHLGEVTAELNERYPEVAGEVSKTMLADRAYLKSIEPKPSTRINNTLTPLAVKPTYAYDQKKAFVDAAIALENPLSVMTDLAKGEFPISKIQALKIRRPLLWGEMRESVIKYSVTREERLPYSREILLGTAFEFPANWAMLNVATIQAAVTAPAKSPNDPTAAPSKVPSDPGKNIAPGGF